MTRHHPFFWDTVQLGSKHAHFFFENGLKWQLLPVNIDSGHPPVFGYYLALVWTCFGKTLLASHLAVLPFLLLNVLLTWRIGRRIAGEKWGAWLPLLLFIDPVLLGQSSMISPDVVVMSSFLLVLEGILTGRKYAILLGTLGLCAISMRGMMTAAALLSWSVLLPQLKGFNFRKLILDTLPFLPGFIFGAGFLLWHFHESGWLGYHPDSPWAGAFKAVGFSGFLRNVAIVGWRWLDFGKVGELLVVGLLGYKFMKEKTLFKPERIPLFSLLVCLLIFLLPSALLYQNLSAHRYFIPAFIACHLLVIQWIAETTLWRENVKRVAFATMLLLLAGGNFWVYPRGISMDWDCTPMHWPYHALRAEALAFLEEKNINFKEVGSHFPNLNTGENLQLNGDQRLFSKKDFAQNRYMFTSNIFNDFSEADYEVLERDWQLIWQKKQGAVWIEIFEKE